VIKTKRVRNVKLYWCLDGRLVVRRYPESARGRWNPVAWLVATTARLVTSRSALRARDSLGWVAALLLGQAMFIAMLRYVWHPPGAIFQWSAVALTLWLSVLLLVGSKCDSIAKRYSWCAYHCNTTDYMLRGGAETMLRANVLAQSADLGPDSQIKLITGLVGGLIPARLRRDHHSTPAKPKAPLLLRWSHHLQTWQRVHHPTPLSPDVLETAVGIWMYGQPSPLATLSTSLELAKHMLATDGVKVG
jgi:hypothetical protein